MFRSFRWKFIIIYFMLVFIAMIISGVFVISYFEQYNFQSVSERLENLSGLILPQLKEFDNLPANSDKIQKLMHQNMNAGFREEIYVIDPLTHGIIATTTDSQGRSASVVLKTEDEFALLANALQGTTGEKRIKQQQLMTMDRAIPIRHSDQITGVLYLRYDLKDTNKTIQQSKDIIIQATLLALVITVLLSYVIAKGITEPINAVTDKAYKMARGDFNQFVDVRSDDEIGKLAEMFNHLTRKLQTTLEEMSQEQSKLEAILHYMADGLIAVDGSGVILHMNSRAQQIFGNQPATAGVNYDEWMELLNPELTVRQIMQMYPAWTGNGQLETDQSVFSVHFAPFCNEIGEKQGLVLVFQDITEQQRLDIMRREFVANVSHELKTPLTSIKSYTETLLDGAVEDPETARQFLKVVDHEADRMSRLVRDLLQLSNFDANMVRLECEFHDYSELMRAVIHKFDVTARNRNQTLCLEMDRDELIGFFDYDRIEQVIQNIVSNALKYTQDGGTVTLHLWSDDDAAIFEVADNGIGIPEADLERIFERFYRVDKARSRNLGGTGLGLSIAKEIVQAHAGVIDIESRVEKGTKVRIRIPLEIA